MILLIRAFKTLTKKVVAMATLGLTIGIMGMGAASASYMPVLAVQPSVSQRGDISQGAYDANRKTYSMNLEINDIISSDKKKLSSSNTLYMESTGYSAYETSGYTASGEHVHYGIAAVDTDVIPMGTSMYVEGYGYAIAADTGGAIVGNRIDLAFDSYQEALNWGRRMVTVSIEG